MNIGVVIDEYWSSYEWILYSFEWILEQLSMNIGVVMDGYWNSYEWILEQL